MKRVKAYIRPMGNRVCATFTNGVFYTTESEEETNDMLADANMKPGEKKNASLPSSWYDAAAIIVGATSNDPPETV